MNIGNAKIWIKALRSGKYIQCRGSITERRNHPSYCCLGVACKVLNGSIPRRNAYDKVFELLDYSIKDEFRFIDMNDRQGKSFEEIAAYIERRITPKAKKKAT